MRAYKFFTLLTGTIGTLELPVAQRRELAAAIADWPNAKRKKQPKELADLGEPDIVKYVAAKFRLDSQRTNAHGQDPTTGAEADHVA